MQNALIAIGILAGLMGLFVGAYSLNAKTKVPEGCEDLTDYSACESCHDHSCMVKARLDKEQQHDQQ